jgi:hypothetical protein
MQGALPRLLAITTVLLAAACTREMEALDLPWPAPSPARSEAGAPGAPPAELDCDVLPALTPEEAARPPHALPDLARTSPQGTGASPRYTVLPDVTLSDPVAARVAAIDAEYARRTGKHLTVTSGTRDAARQAKAMYKMMRLGGDIVRLYRNKDAAREIKDAHDAARSAGKPEGGVVGAMHAVIQGQIERGVYISAHLRAGAVDIRNRDMSAAEKKAFLAATAEAGGVRLLEETTPPHYHLQVEP